MRLKFLANFAPATILLLLAACAGTVAPPGPPHRIESHALADPGTTRLGRVFEAEAAQHPGLSGFDLITSGRTAFEARYAFAHLAQRTIDAQYYLWAGDAVGRNMLEALLEAADRGVRVRLLLDDLNLEGEGLDLAVLNAHPNFEVRLFNPITPHGYEALGFLTDFDRVNHRMHDKAFIVDNTVAIVGGRNMADAYFSANESSNFRDLDLFAAGRVVRDISREFDAFWNSPWAVSVGSVAAAQPNSAELHAAEAKLSAEIDDDGGFPFKTQLDEPYLEHVVATVPHRLIWGQASVLYDEPDKPETSTPRVADELHEKVHGTIEREVLLEIAYFIPSAHGTAQLCDLVAHGVRVRVLTNSLASTDEIAAYAGYMRARDALLRCGVDLHELRPDAAFVQRDWTWLRHRSEAELHTKAVVFDDDRVMIGSFNLDPRSRRLNTEIAILVSSPALAAKVAHFIENGMSLANSFHLELVDGDVVWVAEEHGREVRFSEAPGSDLWRRTKADFLSLLPIEEEL
ncbi:MAG TPA: phospholipase D family protein [Stellaceae bacterium]|nr:phospholipase D family protein [Stellaceae bacterium]